MMSSVLEVSFAWEEQGQAGIPRPWPGADMVPLTEPGSQVWGRCELTFRPVGFDACSGNIQ